MASERIIKQRIKAAKNIAQITRAMQMVAASKMKKAQNLAISGRPYAEKIAEITKKLVTQIDVNKHPLLKKNITGKSLIVLISTNKGLCGGLNTNLFRHLIDLFPKEEAVKQVFVTLGKKGETFLVRIKMQLLADFSMQVPFSSNINALSKFITDGYIKGELKEVYLVYNNFISALRQDPVCKKLLPIQEFKLTSKTENTSEEDKEKLEFLVEPAVDLMLDALILNYLENQVRDAILEAEASEQSARMVAMKNATENANEFTNLLTLEYNKARQEKITYEIADIVTARLAVEE